MLVRYHYYHRFAIEALGQQRVNIDGVGETGEAEIDLPAEQRLLLPLRRELGKADLQLGVALVTLADHLTKAGPENGADQPDADLVALSATRLYHPVEATLQHVEQQGAFGQQQMAGRREAHLAGMAIEQRRPQQGFELPDLGAKRRLGDIEPLGGTAEVAVAGHRVKVA